MATIVGTTGNDTLYGFGSGTGQGSSFAADLLKGGKGRDTYVLSHNDGTWFKDNIEELSTDLDEDTVVMSGQHTATNITSYVIPNYVENFQFEFDGNTVLGANHKTFAFDVTGNFSNNIIWGTGGNNKLNGAEGADSLSGAAGTDTLDGGTGDDTLVGGEGVDSLIGGDGSDVYVLTAATDTADIINETGASGRDRVEADYTYSLGALTALATIEDLKLVGTANINGTGNGLGNVLTGNIGNNTLTGAGGSDTLNGDAGDDVLYGGTPGSGTAYTDGVADTLIGGTGSDTYVLSSDDTLAAIGDTVTEVLQNGSKDVIVMLGSGTLGSYTIASEVENFQFGLDGNSEATANTRTFNFNVTGNNKDNVIWGTGGANTLKGGDGADKLYGGAGNDSLNGEGGDDSLEGGAGDDTLNGDSSIDILNGGAGNDTYYVDNYGDQIKDISGTGDIARTTVDYDFNEANYGDSVESIFLDGVAAKVTANSLNNLVFGNALDNRILGDGGNDFLSGANGNDDLVGESGEDILIGGQGNDVLQGGALGSSNTGYTDTQIDRLEGGLGDDIYIVNDNADTLTELAGEGTDRIVMVSRQTDEYVLKDNFEEFQVAAGYARGFPLLVDSTDMGQISVTGNSANNSLYGIGGTNYLQGLAGHDTLAAGASDDTLDGGTGFDLMIGGQGNDVYYVDSLNDEAREFSGGGNDDLIYTTLTDYWLSAEVESLVLFGEFSLKATGNDGANRLYGNAQANTLDGKLGSDVLAGQDGDDTLDGGGGIDYLLGGVGNDLYRVDNTGDVITEEDVEGIDTVESTASDYTLSAYVENITLVGLGTQIGRGNDLANLMHGSSNANRLEGGLGDDDLYGHDGNDTLDGGEGFDLLFGGNGNDTYYITEADGVLEDANGGTDLVYTANDLFDPLTDNVENLTLLAGTATALRGTGNGLANVLTGNEFDNQLYGMAGNDELAGLLGNDYLSGQSGHDRIDGGQGHDSIYGGTGDDAITGGAGNDTMYGEQGADHYILTSGFGQDTITDLSTDATLDSVDISGGIVHSNLWFQKVNTNDLLVTVRNSTDNFTVKNWFASTNNHVEYIVVSTSNSALALQDTKVQGLIDAMAGLNPASLTPAQTTQVNNAINNAWAPAIQ
jgi:Ca2+-binding RTX toxin-like protein